MNVCMYVCTEQSNGLVCAYLSTVVHAAGEARCSGEAKASQLSYLNDYSSERLAVGLDVQKHDRVLVRTGGKQPRSGDARRAVSYAVFYLQHRCSAETVRTEPQATQALLVFTSDVTRSHSQTATPRGRFRKSTLFGLTSKYPTMSTLQAFSVCQNVQSVNILVHFFTHRVSKPGVSLFSSKIAVFNVSIERLRATLITVLRHIEAAQISRSGHLKRIFSVLI